MASSEPSAFLGLELTAIDDPSSFHAEARYQRVCAVCGRGGCFDAHHVLEARHCRRYGFPLHSPDDALRLCSGGPERCHERHTVHQALVPVACLRDENFAFLAHWMGAAAHGYLQRYYTGADPRLDALLALV